MTIQREKHKVYNNVFDDFTNKIIQKLSSQGFFSEMTQAIGIGKEANVFLANKKDGTRVVVKIYRLENCNFNKMYEYIKGDPRYADLKGRRREIIFNWVSREFRNLHKAREVGVRVPTPHAVMSNVLVMEYIGDEEPAPQLKSIAVENAATFIDDIIDNIKLLYRKANIVHADLSAFNVLVHDEKAIIIDMSQSTSVEDLRAKEFLMRDIENIASYGKKNDVIVDVAKTYKKITGKDMFEKKVRFNN